MSKFATLFDICV